MKKIIMILLTLIFVGSVSAADVTITLTIPDAYVLRLQEAIEHKMNCGELNAKQCLIKRLKGEIRDIVRLYEQERDAKAAKEAVVPIEVD